MDDLFDKMGKMWPAPGFRRADAGKVTGNLISSKTLANLNSLGEGPPVLKFRGRAYYELETFIPWLRHWAGGTK